MNSNEKQTGERYRVERTEEVILGHGRYRIEVLFCTNNPGMEPVALELEPFSVRVYKEMEVMLQSPRANNMNKVWVHFTLNDVHDQKTAEGAVDEALRALKEEVVTSK